MSQEHAATAGSLSVVLQTVRMEIDDDDEDIVEVILRFQSAEFRRASRQVLAQLLNQPKAYRPSVLGLHGPFPSLSNSAMVTGPSPSLAKASRFHSALTKRTSSSNRSNQGKLGTLLDQASFQERSMRIWVTLEAFRNVNSSMQAKYRCLRSLAKMLKGVQRKSVQVPSETPRRTVQKRRRGSKKRPKHRSLQTHCSALQLPIRCFQRQW